MGGKGRVDTLQPAHQEGLKRELEATSVPLLWLGVKLPRDPKGKKRGLEHHKKRVRGDSKRKSDAPEPESATGLTL